jgi:hypothetical protein
MPIAREIVEEHIFGEVEDGRPASSALTKRGETLLARARAPEKGSGRSLRHELMSSARRISAII